MLCIAKLPRQMIQDQSLTIEPEKIALSGEILNGKIFLKYMSRLSEFTEFHDELAIYKLEFLKCDNGVTQIKGEISASLITLCQRCLIKFTLNIKIPVNIGIIKNEEDIALLQDDMEPFLAEDNTISLHNLIEDEILLSLPISPLHSVDVCPVVQTNQKYKSMQDNPFTVLKSLKDRKK
ncbi:MAG: hypothetical protein ACI9XC_002748 [Gammaproteobacteria bacterium]|jgi:uncharacterized protein